MLIEILPWASVGVAHLLNLLLLLFTIGKNHALAVQMAQERFSFRGCNLSCIFCQNHEISHSRFGKEVSIKRLSEIFLELQSKNVHNINLVSPTPYVPQIISALDIAKKQGLTLPIIYNTNSYENIETIKMLNGYVDIYLPDLKYFDDNIAKEYSFAPNYFETATNAIIEMQNQISQNIFDENGIMKKGLIIRHLILPHNIMQTKKILDWIKENMPRDTYISVMAQYFPTFKAKEHPLINRKLTKREYHLVLDMLADFENGFIQDLSDCEEEYVPKFDLSGI